MEMNRVNSRFRRRQRLNDQRSEGNMKTLPLIFLEYQLLRISHCKAGILHSAKLWNNLQLTIATFYSDNETIFEID